MRLPLVAAVLMTTGACARHTVHKVATRVHVYDDSRLTVVSPAVREEMQSGDNRLTAGYTIDVVSGATQALTVDAVTSATQFSEQRQQANVSGAHAFSPQTELSGGYTFSFEPDHTVHAPSVGLTNELLARMVRASVRYQISVESIGRVDTDSFSSDAVGHRIDFGWTQIATKAIVVTALGTATAYTCDENIGCFANPYRYVGVRGLRGGRVALSERHPDARFTGAGALRLSWAFSDSSALHAGYRFSRDSWGISAHSADVAEATELFSDRLLVRTEARGTLQGAASFYRPSYRGDAVAAPAYRTADAELSRLWNVRLQLHLEWAMGPARLVGEFGRMWNQYPDFSSLPKRSAWIAGLGIDLEL